MIYKIGDLVQDIDLINLDKDYLYEYLISLKKFNVIYKSASHEYRYNKFYMEYLSTYTDIFREFK